MDPKVLVLCAAFALLAGCGNSGARYSGGSEARLVDSQNVGTAEAIPSGYDRLGSVTAQCDRIEGYQALDGESLADLDCTRSRLTAALREAAADAGGEVLVGLECGDQGKRRTCSAFVARPGSDRLSERAAKPTAKGTDLPAPSAASVAVLDEPHVNRSWEIRLSLTPSQKSFARPARTPVEVTRTGDLPPHHLPLGDLDARCEREACDPAELVWALRVTAARFGADSLAGVRCSTGEDDEICVGSLGALPVEEPVRSAGR